MALLYHLDQLILWACWIAGIPVGLYAFIHAAMSRPDAFTAADKLTKPAWLGITGVGLFLLVITGSPLRPLGPLFGQSFYGGPVTLFWVAGLIAALIYLVDVRPSLIEIQGGRR
ncbi:MAG TPA: DUF2516 family protein [Pseudonocardia sp.]